MSRLIGPGPQLAPPSPRVSAKMPNSTLVIGGSSGGCEAAMISVGEYGIAVNANGAPSVAKPIAPFAPESVTASVSSKLLASSGRAYGITNFVRSVVQRPLNAPLLRSR